MILTGQQKEAFDRILSFIEGESRVFILKGYAGTGKTTLIQHLVSNLESNHKPFELMAPTGRAAKILRDKTKNKSRNHDGYGSTIHKAIYNYKDVEIIEDEAKS